MSSNFNLNEFLKQQANEIQKQEKEKSNKKPFKFADSFMWTGFENSVPKIIRMLTRKIITDDSEYEHVIPGLGRIYEDSSAKVVNLIPTYSDEGRKIHLFVPDKEKDPSHLYWKLIDTVLKKEWIDDPDKKNKKKGILIYKDSFPDLIDRYITGGYGRELHKDKFNRGFQIIPSIFANVIDRSLIDKHREDKKTYLLSNSVSFGKEDSVFYYWGIKKNSTYSLFIDAMRNYGNFETFDLFMEKTGKADPAFKIFNASIRINTDLEVEIPENLRKLVSKNVELTEEELSWERYNIRDITKPSGIYKWFKNTCVMLKETDKCLGTKFHEEFQEAAHQETIEYNKNKVNKSIVVNESKDEIKTEEKKTEINNEVKKESIVNNSIIEWKDLEDLGYKGKEFFDDFVKEAIISVNKDSIRWKKFENAEEVPCIDSDNCNFLTPELTEFKGCLKCGIKFD